MGERGRQEKVGGVAPPIPILSFLFILSKTRLRR